MRKVLKENSEVDTNISLLTLFKALMMVDAGANKLENDIVSAFENVKTNLIFDVMDIETKEIYQQRMSWHSMREFEELPEKVNHAIIEIATDNGFVSVGYNPASNFLSFSKNEGPVKFYSFTNKPRAFVNDPERISNEPMYKEFKIIMERLLG